MRKGSFKVYGIHQEGHVLVFDVLAQNFGTMDKFMVMYSLFEAICRKAV
jgi:hypothetical protein